MSTVVVVDPAAVRALLKSSAVQALLRQKADAIADAAAGDDMRAGVDMVAGVDLDADRAVGYVVTATAKAMAEEAKERRLTQAIGAGRG